MENNTNKPSECTEKVCCGCVGYAYVPKQTFDTTYEPAKGLVQGTIFPELDLSIDEYGKVCKGTGGIN